MCVDKQYNRPNKTYFVEAVIVRILNDIMYKQDYGCRLIKWEFNKTFFLTKKVLNDGFVKKKLKKEMTK